MKKNNPTKTVLMMGQIKLSGNITPNSWYQHIKYGKKDRYGKEHFYPHLLAIAILSDLCYWYSPREIRDERTGQTVGYEKRFAGDLLQRNYKQLNEQFGCSKKQSREAMELLESLGLAKRKFDTAYTEQGSIPNVMYIDIFPENIAKISMNPHSYQLGTMVYPIGNGDCAQLGDSGNAQLGTTNTESTTSNTTVKEKEEKENFIQKIPNLKKRIGKPLFDALLKVAESEENLTRLESLNECKKFELLLQWLEYRNDRKKKLTPKGILILVTKFEQFDNEAISVAIEKSIESNYTGLFIKPIQKQPVQQPNEPPKDANGNEIRYKPQGDLKGYAKILALRDKIQAQKAAQ